ncbi:MAG: hypothetical protein ACR2MQ_06625 [Gemmatimonadaceae bacterium]
MTRWTRVALCGAAAVIIFDTAASLLARMTGSAHGSTAIGLTVIYAVIGYLAARAMQSKRLLAAARAGILLGLTDASAGSAISWVIRPAVWHRGLTLGWWIAIAIFVTVLATLIATIGGLVAQWRNRTATPAAT